MSAEEENDIGINPDVDTNTEHDGERMVKNTTNSRSVESRTIINLVTTGKMILEFNNKQDDVTTSQDQRDVIDKITCRDVQINVQDLSATPQSASQQENNTLNASEHTGLSQQSENDAETPTVDQSSTHENVRAFPPEVTTGTLDTIKTAVIKSLSPLVNNNHDNDLVDSEKLVTDQTLKTGHSFPCENGEQQTKESRIPQTEVSKSEQIETDTSNQNITLKAADANDDVDTHCCGKCKIVFTSLDDYVCHKLDKDNCKVTYTKPYKNRKLLIPQVVEKDIKAFSETSEQLQIAENRGPTKRKRGRPPGTKKKPQEKRKEDEIQIMHNYDKTYKCKLCIKTFSRDAALQRHIRFDHAVKEEDEEEDDSDEDEEWANEGSDKGSQDPAFTMPLPPRKPKVADSSKDDPETRPFKCKLCDKSFREFNVLKTHMLTHTESRDYKCTQSGCIFSFKTKGSLKRHMRRHTGERPFSCDLCKRSFSESGALTRHLRSRIPCTSKTDADLPRYGKRVKLDADTGTYGYIDENNTQIVYRFDLVETGEDEDLYKMVPNSTVKQMPKSENDQVEIAAPEENEMVDFPILEAEEVINEQVVEATDVTEEEKEPDNSCRACRALFETPSILKEHLKEHVADLPFRCGLCTFAAARKDHLNLHMQNVHQTQLKEMKKTTEEETTAAENEETETAEPTKEVQEAQSEKSRVAAIAIKQLLEMRDVSQVLTEVKSGVHGQKTLHKCPICSRSFRGLSYMRVHMRSHTGERPHRCEVCEKSFTTRDALNKHMFVHSEDRNYKCGECGKMFKRISHVKEHLKIHSAERPYTCSLCDKSFKSHNACKVHMRTHSDALPYECNICLRSFREKGSLERHVRTHTGEKPFQCKHCGRSFAEHGTLNRHLKAKVPCTKALEVNRQAMEQTDIITETAVIPGSAEFPTVLAEFSSVVASTQQYLIQPDDIMQSEQIQHIDDVPTGAEIVVIAPDISSEGAQNIEVVADEKDNGDKVVTFNPNQQTQYMVLEQTDDKITLFNQETGETLTYMTGESSDVTMEEVEGIQEVTIMEPEVADHIEAVAMAPASDSEDAVQQAMMVADLVEDLPVEINESG